MITVGRDGPNVNKTVLRILNEAVKAERGSPLLDIGSCNLHIFHNACQAGLEEFGSRVETFSTTIFDFFDGWPSRWESYCDCRAEFAEKEEDARATKPSSASSASKDKDTSDPSTGTLSHRFIKHARTRWLTLLKSVERLDEQWPYLTEYFLKYIPNGTTSNSKKLMKQVQYKFIVECLKDRLMRAEVAFVMESSRIIDRVSLTFQKREPMIHLLYEEVELLTSTVMGRACKPNTDLSLESLKDTSNRLPVKKVQCGDAVERYLKTQSGIEELDVVTFKQSAQKHFIAVAEHLLKKSILSGAPVTKHFRCVKPDERTKERSERSIAQVARALPFETDVCGLVDEWRLLRVEGDIKTEDGDGGKIRVDRYWQQIFERQNAAHEPKFPKITQVVKAILAIPHGSAEVERGFSISKHDLTPEKNRMVARTLNAKLNIKSAMQRYDCKPERVPITRELLTSARFARSKYQEYLEQQRREAEKVKRDRIEREEDRKRKEEEDKKQAKTFKDLKTLEGDLDKANKDFLSKRNAIEKLSKQANESLKNALDKNDMDGVRVAQGMLDGVESMEGKAKEAERKVQDLQKKIDKRKSFLLSSIAPKKPKND